MARIKNLLVVGGGEGATLREVLKHRSITRAVMVDVDAEAVSLCMEYLPSMNSGVFTDPRVVLRHEDAWDFLERYRGRCFDVIICDLTEP